MPDDVSDAGHDGVMVVGMTMIVGMVMVALMIVVMGVGVLVNVLLCC